VFRFVTILAVVVISLYLVMGSSLVNANDIDPLRKDVQNRIDESTKLIETGSLYSAKQALSLLDSLKNIVSTTLGTADSLYAIILHHTSQCHRTLENYDDAIAAASQAVEIWEHLNNDHRYGLLGALHQLYQAYRSKGDLATCNEISNRQFEILDSLLEPESIDAREARAKALNLRGRLRIQQGRGDEGLADFREGLNLINGDIPYLQAWLNGNIGWVLFMKGNYEDSKKYILKSLDLTRKAHGEKHIDILSSYNQLSAIASQQGNYELADSFLSESILLAEEWYDSNYVMYVDLLAQKATLQLRFNKVDSATIWAKRAISMERSRLIHPTNAWGLLTGGNVALVTNQFELANEAFREYLNIRHKFLRTVFAYASGSQKSAYFRGYTPIIATLLSSLAVNDNIEARCLALEMAMSGKGLVIDAIANEQARATCSADPVVDSLVSGHRAVCDRIAQLAMSRLNPTEGDRDWLSELYAEKDAFEAELSRLCSRLEFEQNAGLISADSVAASLPSGTVLWEFIKYDRTDLSTLYRDIQNSRKYYLVLTLSPDGEVGVFDLGPASPIDSLITVYREEMSRALATLYGQQATGSSDGLTDVTVKLYERLIAPLGPALDSAKEVFIAADGMINLLPFESLTEDGSRYLIEDHQFVYVTSGRDLLNDRSAGVNRQAVVVANPDYMEDPAPAPALTSVGPPDLPIARGKVATPECLASMFSPLPMTRQEGLIIAQLLERTGDLKVRYLESGDANEAALKNLRLPPRVLHIATHAYFCPETERDVLSNPLLRSGLVLAGANQTIGQLDDDRMDGEDGILTALEASGLNLVGTELVVLSACQTGIGDIQSGEGVFGLRRAFQHAGVRSIVMSMFDVPDETTPELMKRFYENWLSGQSKSAALRNASLSILRERREKNGSAHPLYWGGFIFVGDPN
jgi:CHAT domain-containing protein